MQCHYLPPRRGTLRRLYHEIFLYLGYDVWRREIQRFGKWSSYDTLDILECGCGPGYLLKFLERWFPRAHIVGLELERQLIWSALEQTRCTRFAQASAQQIPFRSRSFDLIVALHLIEHLSQPASFITETRRLLRPGGLLIIATPNPAGIGARVMGKQWSGWTDESHIALNAPRVWKSLISDHGFDILKDGTTGLSGIPILRTLPFALLNWGVLFLFGFLPWKYGEAYVCVATPAISPASFAASVE